jgi:hypothetical protein
LEQLVCGLTSKAHAAAGLASREHVAGIGRTCNGWRQKNLGPAYVFFFIPCLAESRAVVEACRTIDQGLKNRLVFSKSIKPAWFGFAGWPKTNRLNLKILKI